MRGCSLGDFFRLGQGSGMACTVMPATVATGRTMCTCHSLHQGHRQHRQVHDLVGNGPHDHQPCSMGARTLRRCMCASRSRCVSSSAYLSARKALLEPSMGINRFFKGNPFGRLSGPPTNRQSAGRRATVWETGLVTVSQANQADLLIEIKIRCDQAWIALWFDEIIAGGVADH